MARGIHKLTDAKIKKLTKPGRYGDGGNLCLQVEPGGGKNFLFICKRDGRTVLIGLGRYADIGLAGARDKASRMRALIAEGRDPRQSVEVRQAATSISFLDAARAYAADKKANWENPVSRNQWFKHMLGEDESGNKVKPKHNYCKSLHDLDVRDIGLDEVKATLAPIWVDKVETARRIRGRIEQVLDWATAHKYRAGDNPARWSGLLQHVLPAQKPKVKHFRTLPYTEMPAFMAKLLQQDGISPKALAFTILTVARTSSIIGIEGRDDTPPLDWSHIDVDAKLWTIPRVKNDDTNFVIPLSEPALKILREVRRLTGGSGIVFPGDPKDTPLSNNAMLAVFRRMSVAATTHGMARSGFETWSKEETAHEAKVIDVCMSHGKQDKLEASYHRGSFLAKRRALMDDWAAFLLPGASRLQVVA